MFKEWYQRWKSNRPALWLMFSIVMGWLGMLTVFIMSEHAGPSADISGIARGTSLIVLLTLGVATGFFDAIIVIGRRLIQRVQV